MQQVTAGELIEVFDHLSRNLAQYEGTYAALEERLRSLEREFRDRQAILDKFAIISETDTRGVITYANSKFCEVSGYTLEELVGKPHNIIRHPDMPREAFKELWDTIKAGQIWQGEVKNRRKDGSAYWVLATVGPLLDAEGYPYRYVSMRIDITKLKELEAKLRQERDQLAHELEENFKLAGAIQQALLPPTETSPSSSSFPLPYFVILHSQQKVKGTFYWLHATRGRCLIFVGDIRKGGIARGLLSVLCIQLLRHLVKDRGILSPERVVEELDNHLARFFQSKPPFPIEGMVILVDFLRLKLSYLALGTQAVLFRQGSVIPLTSYPHHFGEMTSRYARETTIALAPADRLYVYAGESFHPDMKAEFQTFYPLDFARQREAFSQALSPHFSGELLILGIEIPSA